MFTRRLYVHHYITPKSKITDFPQILSISTRRRSSQFTSTWLPSRWNIIGVISSPVFKVFNSASEYYSFLISYWALYSFNKRTLWCCVKKIFMSKYLLHPRKNTELTVLHPIPPSLYSRYVPVAFRSQYHSVGASCSIS